MNMFSKGQAYRRDKASAAQLSLKPKAQKLDSSVRAPHPAIIIQRAVFDPDSLTPHDILQLQRTMGNQAVGRLLKRIKRHQEANNGSNPVKSILSASKGQTGAAGALIQRRTIKLGTGGKAELGALGPYGYGTGMSAELTSWNHLSEGSSPTVKPPNYPASVQWYQSYMVQGHLLNDNLGGPGNALDNLAPITKKTNSRHLHAVETMAKNMVIGKDQPIAYSVDVVPGPPSPQNFPNYPQDQASQNYFAKLPGGFEVLLQDGDGNTLVDTVIPNSDV
jgi:hypothetical protein